MSITGDRGRRRRGGRLGPPPGRASWHSIQIVEGPFRLIPRISLGLLWEVISGPARLIENYGRLEGHWGSRIRQSRDLPAKPKFEKQIIASGEGRNTMLSIARGAGLSWRDGSREGGQVFGYASLYDAPRSEQRPLPNFFYRGRPKHNGCRRATMRRSRLGCCGQHLKRQGAVTSIWA